MAMSKKNNKNGIIHGTDMLSILAFMHFEPSLLNQRFFLTKVVGKKMDMH
jgi:hypothetical protein